MPGTVHGIGDLSMIKNKKVPILWELHIWEGGDNVEEIQKCAIEGIPE